MNITVIGAGYVGLVTAACFAEAGYNVTCIDKNEEKVEKLKRGHVYLSEPNLTDIISSVLKDNRIIFSTDIKTGLDRSNICFIAVDTPSTEGGSANISNVLAVAESLGQYLEKKTIVVVKSTVPVGTTSKVGNIIQEGLKRRNKDTNLISMTFNPEFLMQGSAVDCFKKPDRVIVGVEDEAVEKVLKDLYSPFMLKSNRFISMDITSAELTKYAANSMLATRISFMNSLARLCDKIGANIDIVRHGIGSDPRIGNDFLYPGLGYGGSCFPKDLKALIHLAKEYGEKLSIVEAADEINETQVDWFFNKIKTYFADKGGLKGRLFALWGLSFKANTDDIRESRSLKLIELLVKNGALIRAYDPKAMTRIEPLVDNSVKLCNCNYECVVDADALIVCNEWHEFRSPDWDRIKSHMKTPVIFDGKNMYSSLVQFGLDKISIGGKP